MARRTTKRSKANSRQMAFPIMVAMLVTFACISGYLLHSRMGDVHQIIAQHEAMAVSKLRPEMPPSEEMKQPKIVQETTTTTVATTAATKATTTTSSAMTTKTKTTQEPPMPERRGVPTLNIVQPTPEQPVLQEKGEDGLRPPLSSRRYLFGIFTYDNDEAKVQRDNIRQTYLSYYTKSIEPVIHEEEKKTICSLNQLLANTTLQADPRACLFVYTFVMGGGDPKTQPPVCYYPECGDKADGYIVASPQYNYSDPTEIATHNDITFLSVRENANDGKSEAWFTYAAALVALERQDLNIQYVGKLDSDAIMFVDRFWGYLRSIETQLSQTYVYLGWFITRTVCRKSYWKKVCDNPLFKTPAYALGGCYFMSQATARYAYLDGTSLQNRKSLFYPDEDVSQGNMILATQGRLTHENVTLVQLPQTSPASHGTAFKTVSRQYKNYFKRCGCKYPEE